MDHRLVTGIKEALGWQDTSPLGVDFARGTMPEPAICSRILTPTKLLDLIMRRSLNTPQLRIFQDGSDVLPNDYLDPTLTRRGQNISMPNMRRIGNLIGSGCTVVLDSVDTFDPAMEVACRALQWWTHELVQVNTYLTTQDASGFNLHWDDHDVIVVQLSGEKEWEVRGLSRQVPMYRDAEENRTPPDRVIWSGSLRPGDVMHIPRGYWHQATRNGQGSGFSLHATFGFVQRTGVDWLKWISDQARENELFRRDLNRSDSSDVEQQRLHLTTAVAQLIASRPPTSYLTDRENERPAHRHVATANIFGEPSEIVCITEFEPQIEKKDGLVHVVAAGKKITFTEKATPALLPLLSGNPVSVSQISQDTGINATKLAELLLQEEICAELTPELCSGYTDLVTFGKHSRQQLTSGLMH